MRTFLARARGSRLSWQVRICAAALLCLGVRAAEAQLVALPRVEERPFTVAQGATSSQAECQPNEVVVGGGFYFLATSGIAATHSSPDVPLRRWGAMATNSSGAPVPDARVNALCAPLIDDVTITPSGNVGIGTPSPGSKLEVQGDVRATGVVQMGYRVVTGPTIQLVPNQTVGPQPVSCTDRELPISGGWEILSGAVTVLTSRPSGGNSWLFRVQGGARPSRVTLYVTCARIAN